MSSISACDLSPRMTYRCVSPSGKVYSNAVPSPDFCSAAATSRPIRSNSSLISDPVMILRRSHSVPAVGLTSRLSGALRASAPTVG